MRNIIISAIAGMLIMTASAAAEAQAYTVSDYNQNYWDCYNYASRTASSSYEGWIIAYQQCMRQKLSDHYSYMGQ